MMKNKRYFININGNNQKNYILKQFEKEEKIKICKKFNNGKLFEDFENLINYDYVVPSYELRLSYDSNCINIYVRPPLRNHKHCSDEFPNIINYGIYLGIDSIFAGIERALAPKIYIRHLNLNSENECYLLYKILKRKK